MSESDDEPVAVPRQVHCELETLRELDGCDLLSPDVLDVLAAYDFDAARAWAVEHPDRYVRAVEAGTVDRTVATDGGDGS